jgi:ubiquinone/menaquinone biosynthesis C-methylase UbiE
MVRLVFGDYLSERPKLGKSSKVLDVGCGFGQNLLPFVLIDAECHGVEISQSIADSSREAILRRGIDAEIKVGTNQSLPYDSDTFDLLLSIDTIHYESSYDGMRKGLAEFARVLKPGGLLIMTTVAPLHDMQVRGERLAPNNWKIRDYDFRNGETMTFFEQEETLRSELSRSFSRFDTGRITQKMMKQSLDWFVCAAWK